MSSLRHILNPEVSAGRSSLSSMDVDSPMLPYSEPPLSPSGSASSGTVEAADDLDNQNHESHVNCPDSLDCLPDTSGRPQHTLPVILRCAILGSPRQRLTIREIYAAMENKYMYYKTAGSTWKQSVRHHLSLNRLFERQPRPVTDPGFGSYWTVNLEAPPGTKRPRKRGRNNAKLADTDPKKRGRPRKPDETPAKSPTLEDASANAEDAEMSSQDIANDEDFESEDETVHPLDHRTSLARMQLGIAQPPPPTPVPVPIAPAAMPSSASYKAVHDPAEIIERLNIEVQTLRQATADSNHQSARLTDQLSEVQAELARNKAHHKRLESMLADESRKRAEAEQQTDQELRRRRSLEQELEQLRHRLRDPPEGKRIIE